MFGFAYVVIFTLAAALLAATAQLLFKSSIKQFKLNKEGILSVFKNRQIIIGIVVYVIGLGIYLQALHFGELSFIYPIFASVFIFVALISKYKLREKIGIARAAGIGLIILGIILTALTF